MLSCLKAPLIILVMNIANSQRPNVCRRFIDYYTMNPRNCWYNPEVNMNATEIILHQGYPLETYEAVTEDDYLLTVYRIPKKNPKGVVYLQHPATSSCVSWIDKGKHESPGFILWDNGYDIWLGNFRGTYYSRRHKYLDPNQEKYWNFSLHEHGIYDIPAQVDLIARVTNAAPGSITFIGDSMGSTAGAIYATLKVEHSKQWMKVVVLLAPPLNMIHANKILGMLGPYIDEIYDFTQRIHLYEFIAYSNFIRNLLWTCRNAPTMVICLILETTLLEDDLEEQSPEFYPMKWGHNPGGVSVKAMIHYGQIIKNGGHFTFFDYGKAKNMEYYHTETPPVYPAENVAVPLFFMVANHDKLASPQDVAVFYSHLSEIGKKYGIYLVNNVSHTTFMYGYTSCKKVYMPLLHFLDKIHTEDGNK